MNKATLATRFFGSNKSASTSNASIASELRALADRLESKENTVVALGAVLALQVGETKFESVMLGKPVPDFRDGILITDSEARVVRVENE